MQRQADTRLPQGLEGSGCIGEAELALLLVGRRIIGVSFQKEAADINWQDTLLLALDDGSTVSVRGQGNEIQSVDVVFKAAS